MTEKRTDAEYLERIVAANTLAPDSAAAEELQAAREQVEDVLRAEFGSDPRIRYGGSHAKGTMVLTSYDLDLLCYFPRDTEDADATLADLYARVKKALEKDYHVEPKRSALRLREKQGRSDLRIDVVPGRFIDESNTDVYLHQSAAEKSRLKTNPDTHISHVRGSGLLPAVKLAKIWRVRFGIGVKTFVLELLVIKTLKGHRTDPLDDQMKRLFEELRDNAVNLAVADPANSNNDLAPLLDEVRDALQAAADQALDLITSSGWVSVFGALPEDGSSHIAKSERIARLASNDRTRAKPWSR